MSTTIESPLRSTTRSSLAEPAVEPRSVSTRANPFAPWTYAMTAIALLLVVLLLPKSAYAAALIAAVLCGWAEVDGLCGTSHVAALTPLMQLKGRRLWITAVAAYATGGMITALVVGMMVGVLGAGVRLSLSSANLIALLTMAVAAVLITREARIVEFELPQVHRQTHKMWALKFGFVPGALMWGAHIGLGFATVIRHGGLYIIAAAALSVSPLSAAGLMTAFWSGRTLPLLLAPLITRESRDGDHLVDLLSRPTAAFRVCSIVAIAGVATAAAIIRLSNT